MTSTEMVQRGPFWGGIRTKAQAPRAENGCISAQHYLVEDATGETVEFPTMALSRSPFIRFGASTWIY